MATVYLHRSDCEFWDMTPRQLIILIDEWKTIEKNRDILRAYIANGGNPDEINRPDDVAQTNGEIWAQI